MSSAKIRSDNFELSDTAKYIMNPGDPYNVLEVSFEWDTRQALRIVADIIGKNVYIFPYWLLHSSFLENELHLDYELLMNHPDKYFFGSISVHSRGNPFAIVESSQMNYLIETLGGKKEMLVYLEDKLAWLRYYGIEPTCGLELASESSECL